MHESARELNQPLVERAVRFVPVREPQFLQHVVRLVKELPVEAVEESEVVGVQFLPAKGIYELRNVRALLAHAESLRTAGRGRKPKARRSLARIGANGLRGHGRPLILGSRQKVSPVKAHGFRSVMGPLHRWKPYQVNRLLILLAAATAMVTVAVPSVGGVKTVLAKEFQC